MKTLLAAAGLAALASSASALPIIAYNPAATAGSVPAIGAHTAPGVTADDLARGAGLTAPSPLLSNNYNSVGFGASDEAGARAANDFVSWGFTSTQGYDLTSLAINYGRGANGPREFLIEISVDGGLNYDTIHTYTFPTSPAQILSFDSIDLSAYDDVTSADFRFYGWNAVNGSTGRASIVDAGSDYIADSDAGLAVFGEATPVPLPAAGAMLLLGLGGLGVMARRRA